MITASIADTDFDYKRDHIYQLFTHHSFEATEPSTKLLFATNHSTRKVIMTSASLILQQDYYDREPDMSNAISPQTAHVSGSASFYCLYSVPDYNMSSTGSCVVVDSTKPVQLKFKVQSYQGFNTTGVVLFKHYEYSGNAEHITQSNPALTIAKVGLSSLIVSHGSWQLYDQPDYKGNLIPLPGSCETIFRPGKYRLDLQYNDKAKSIKLVDDCIKITQITRPL